MTRHRSADGQRPRVVVYRDDFLSPSETFIRHHVLEMPRYSVRVLTSRRVSPTLEVPGVPVEVIRPGPVLGRAVQGVGRRLGVSSSTMAWIAALRHLSHDRPDVLHAHFGPDGALVAPAARLLRIPLVVTFHGFDVTKDRSAFALWRATNQAYVWRWPALVSSMAAVITVSTFLKERLVEQGIEPGRISVIPCGIDTSAFEWTPYRADGPLVFVGRLVEKKGVSDLLDAVHTAGISRRLVVIGDGPLRARLEQRAKDLRLDVRFEGVRDSRSIRLAMQSASIVVMPSKRAANGDAEGFGVVALEAAASGRPVVGYRHGGLPEAVTDHVTGRLVTEGDSQALGQVLHGVLEDPVLADRLGRAGREHVERNFQRSALLARVADVYDSIRRTSRTHHDIRDKRKASNFDD